MYSVRFILSVLSVAQLIVRRDKDGNISGVIVRMLTA